jgi:predicted ArsR family transcriptional regulator
MFKIAHHPKAFLTLRRNVQRGLLARTRIILILEEEASNAKKLAQETGLSYVSVLHHLHLLEAENILTYKGKRPYLWELTGAGQQRLTNVGGKK